MRNALLLGALLLGTMSACPPGTTSYDAPGWSGPNLVLPLCGDVVGDCFPTTPNTTLASPKR